MLKKRVLTALVLIPLFLVLLFKLPPTGFMIFTACIMLLGAWEWSAFMGIKPRLLRLCYPVFVYGFLSFPYFLPIQVVLSMAVAWWLVALIFVYRYPQGATVWGKSLLLRGIMGLFVLEPAWRALNHIRDSEIYGTDQGIGVLLYFFLLIWGADTGAYFAGKKWGKTKLAPHVSPGKTLQGLIGALVVTTLIAPGLLYWVPGLNIFAVILLGWMTVLFSILGDLFESMLKRNVDLKDSGHLLPGHGGLLDRIDSLTAAAPVFALGSWLLLQVGH
jgi:phosphatidate cytidylyltransferase